MAIKKITQKIRDIRRLKHILMILTKHGFGFAIQRLHLDGFISEKGIIKSSILRFLPAPKESWAVRFREVLEELGPTFIKFGQILSVRPDLIPMDLCNELSKLQDRVPSFSYDEVKKQIVESLGGLPEEVFAHFYHKPLAAASLGQVHRARLHSGEQVVVKIQRPDLRKIIETDIDILSTIAQLVNKYMLDIRVLDPVGIVDEFSKVITKEIDFTNEAHNVDRFRKNFKNSEDIYVPKVFWEYTKAKVLTLEEIKGIRLNDYLAGPHSDEDKKTVASKGANAILQQIFIDGFYHADPHPGNLFVLPEKKTAFVDFGIVGKLDDDTRHSIASLLIAVYTKNMDGILKVLVRLEAIEEKESAQEFKCDMHDFIERYYDVPLKQIDLSTILRQAIDMMTRHKIKIPSQFHILFKSLTTIDGVARQLCPDFNMVTHARPFIEKLIREKHDPKRLFKEFEQYSAEILDIFRLIPKDAHDILRKIKKGSLKIEFEHQGLSKFIAEMDKSSNRISFSLVISALIIGSALIIMTNKGPLVYGFSILGIMGFLFAGFLGLALAVGILKSGRL